MPIYQLFIESFKKSACGGEEMMRVLTMIIAIVYINHSKFESYQRCFPTAKQKIRVRAFYQLRFGISRCWCFSKHVVIDHQRALRHHKSEIRFNMCQASQSRLPKMFFGLGIDLNGFTDADATRRASNKLKRAKHIHRMIFNLRQNCANNKAILTCDWRSSSQF